MLKPETLTDFYARSHQNPPAAAAGQFNVFRLEEVMAEGGKPVEYRRRDFYKVALVRGRNVYHYADRSLAIEQPTLLFFNPRVPYTWQPLGDDINGYFCIFRQAFLANRGGTRLVDLPIFQPGGEPAYGLSDQQEGLVGELFEKMLVEIESDYPLKYELLGNYVAELIHQALKLSPSTYLYQHPDAKSRLTAVFTELLERQFPIESPDRQLRLRSARNFADQLAVHVNHLNRCVRHTTGKTTTELIAARVVTEALALLRHTDWPIAQVGYSLGFDEAAHFTTFFKKHAGLTPSAYRDV